MSEPATRKDRVDPDRTLDVVRALWTLHHALEAASERMEARIGITAPQRMIVRLLGRYPATTAGQLAAMLGVHNGTLSKQIRRLEERGLVTRLRDPRDSRRVMLGLTRAGRAFDQPLPGTIEQSIHAALENMDPTLIDSTMEAIACFREALSRVATGDGKGSK